MKNAGKQIEPSPEGIGIQTEDNIGTDGKSVGIGYKSATDELDAGIGC